MHLTAQLAEQNGGTRIPNDQSIGTSSSRLKENSPARSTNMGNEQRELEETGKDFMMQQQQLNA